MKKVLCSILPILAIALVLAMSGAAFAQTVDPGDFIPGTIDDVFTTNYFSNNAVVGAPHGTFRATNDGSTERDICANVYVFDSNQEMKECCSCRITPDGMRTWDINTDLNSMPANGAVAHQGVIQVISTDGGNPFETSTDVCDATFGIIPFYPGSFNPGAAELEPELESWATHVQVSNLPVAPTKAKPTGVPATYSLTETQSIEEELSFDELNFLPSECASITNGQFGSGSGVGQCGCGFEL